MSQVIARFDQKCDCVIFQDLGRALATLQAAKASDFFGCLPGHSLEIADADQACIQAEMKGDPTLICLPPEARPSWWNKCFPHLRRPVRRLKQALYGHPDAGTYLGTEVWFTYKISWVRTYQQRVAFT